MSKLFWQMSVTLDGFMEGPSHELDDTAQVVDKDFDRYASEMLASIDGMLLGRVTYQLFADYWPTASDPEAGMMNGLPKYVVSKTLESVDWSNAHLVEGDTVQEVAELKRRSGKDLALFGSARLASTLMRAGLIDEYRIFVNPVVIGEGIPMFKDIGDKVALKLAKSDTFSSGIVALYYEPAGTTA